MILIVNILAASIDIGHCLHHHVVCTRYIANVQARDAPSVGVILNFTVKLTRLTKFLVGLETLFYGFALVCQLTFFLWSSVHFYLLIMGKSFSFAVLFPYSGFLLMTMILNLNLTCMMLFIAQGR